MAENFYDLVLEKMFEKRYLVKRALHKKFQKTNPPRMVEIDPQKMTEEYQNLSIPQISALKTVYGEDSYNGYENYMEQLIGEQNAKRR